MKKNSKKNRRARKYAFRQAISLELAKTFSGDRSQLDHRLMKRFRCSSSEEAFKLWWQANEERGDKPIDPELEEIIRKSGIFKI